MLSTLLIFLAVFYALPCIREDTGFAAFAIHAEHALRSAPFGIQLRTRPTAARDQAQIAIVARLAFELMVEKGKSRKKPEQRPQRTEKPAQMST